MHDFHIVYQQLSKKTKLRVISFSIDVGQPEHPFKLIWISSVRSKSQKLARCIWKWQAFTSKLFWWKSISLSTLVTNFPPNHDPLTIRICISTVSVWELLFLWLPRPVLNFHIYNFIHIISLWMGKGTRYILEQCNVRSTCISSPSYQNV